MGGFMELRTRLCLGLGHAPLPSPPCWALGSFGLFPSSDRNRAIIKMGIFFEELEL